MASEEFLCVRCARHTVTCCQRSEIYVTPGDVERIQSHTGREDFVEFRCADNHEYVDQDDDPVWRDHVFRADGSRRVLRRKENGDCTFLGEHGCVMPLDTRPLICRLYPFDYTADGLSDELALGCPLELLLPGQSLLGALEMNVADAERWHRQLYEEVQQEVHI
ncbi:MAG: YkgJ family cysteine cluster protein [Planctomycetales bacterium]|nr:YkgJ family cysteine cluster protein [Planctomycetales bacterium]MCA9168259.1 YkgJ family cysteine cluster protein [Planctomycetales bacterium]